MPLNTINLNADFSNYSIDTLCILRDKIEGLIQEHHEHAADEIEINLRDILLQADDAGYRVYIDGSYINADCCDITVEFMDE